MTSSISAGPWSAYSWRKRCAPTWLALRCAIRSPRTFSGMRTLPRITRIRSGSNSPPRTRRTGRMRKPLGERVAHALHRFGAGLRAAHIDMVGGVDRIAQQGVALEDRRDQEDVGEMPAAEIGIVGGQHVAGPQRFGRDVAQDVLHDVGHRAEMAGREVALRDQPRLAIEQAGGEILALPHRFGECGAAERAAHLVGDRDQAVPDDGQGDRVDAREPWRVMLRP